MIWPGTTQGRTLILAPHCDDITLALAGTLLTFGDVLRPLKGLIVFSKSNYTQAGTVRDVTAVTLLREAEERAAAFRLGYEPLFGGFGEPLVRGVVASLDAIFDHTCDPQVDACFASVEKLVHCEIERGCTLVLGPLGLGGHLDHRILRTVIDRLSTKLPRTNFAFYEDLPYVGELSDGALQQVEQSLHGQGLRPWPQKNDRLDDKLGILRLFRSQLDDEDRNSVRRHFLRLGGERVWSYGIS